MMQILPTFHRHKPGRISALAGVLATTIATAAIAGQNDPAEIKSLQVGAVFNDTQFQIRFVVPTDTPSWYHQYLVYDDGEWIRHGSGADGPDPDGLYEDRISIMIDDGSVEGFSEIGGYATVHPGMRSTASEIPADIVEDHPHLGQRLGGSDIRKFILESRTPSAPEDAWHSVRPVEELETLRERGIFIDLWQWRAHRSNPIGFADNGYILDGRHSSEGTPMFTDNIDPDTKLPRRMYDPGITGFHALNFDDLKARKYIQDDPYFLRREDSLPFDPDHNWQRGDALPQRLLQTPDGSRGAIRAEGTYRDGAWHVRLSRSLESPNPKDSKSLVPGKTVNVAFAVHNRAGARHHQVSQPMSLGLGTDADITATKVKGDLDEATVEMQEIPLFNPPDPTASADRGE